MNIAQVSAAELVGTLLGFALTLFVFSYIFGDNPLFRFTMSVFVGVASGYAAVVVWYKVIWGQLLRPLVFGSQAERLYLLFPLFFSALLLLKLSPRLTRLGNPALAYLVGVGVAAAIGGAMAGTIFPQFTASINLFDLDRMNPDESLLWQLFRGGMVLLGTLTTLVYFHYGAKRGLGRGPVRPEWLEWLAVIGQVFIAITFGALFAGVFSAALLALIERLNFLIGFITSLF